MLANERGQFAKLVETMCAAFNVPATEARIDAYWRGCHRMQLAQFERTIDYLCGPECNEDDLPSPRRMYSLHRQMLAAERAAASKPPPGPAEPETEEQQRERGIRCYCNRLLLLFLNQQARRHGSGASDDSLLQLVACKNRYVAAYCQHVAEDPAASLELRDVLIDALEPLWVPRTPNVPRGSLTVDEAMMPLGEVALR